MGHVRACPECGIIVEWSKGELEPHTLPSGKVIHSRRCWLECPEHGPFDNVSKKLAEKLERLARGLKSEL